jgi:hypothetical protein
MSYRAISEATYEKKDTLLRSMVLFCAFAELARRALGSGNKSGTPSRFAEEN